MIYSIKLQNFPFNKNEFYFQGGIPTLEVDWHGPASLEQDNHKLLIYDGIQWNPE